MTGDDQDRTLWQAVVRCRAADRGFDDNAGWLHPVTDKAIKAGDRTEGLACMFEAIAATAADAALGLRLDGDVDHLDEDGLRALRDLVGDLSEGCSVLGQIVGASSGPTSQ